MEDPLLRKAETDSFRSLRAVHPLVFLRGVGS